MRLLSFPRWTLALSLCAWSTLLLAQAPASIRDDPVFGTWVLEKDKSDFRGQRPLQEQIRIFEPHETGVRAKVVTIDADGRGTVTEYVAAYDGVEYPFRGSQNVDAVILTREGPFRAVTTFRHGQLVLGHARRDISSDGKTMTVTVQVRDSFDRVTVFRKVN